MKPFNVGVVGIGDISDVYIKNLQKYDIVNVTACAGRDLEKAKAKASAMDCREPTPRRPNSSPIRASTSSSISRCPPRTPNSTLWR